MKISGLESTTSQATEISFWSRPYWVGVLVFVEGGNHQVRRSKPGCSWGNQKLSPFGFHCLVTMQSLDFLLNLSFLVKPTKQIYFVSRNLMLRACSKQKISSNPQPLMYPSISDQ